MPSNLELKKSLEQTKKQLVVKDKEIAELNAKLSKFLALEESVEDSASEPRIPVSDKTLENVPVDISVDIEPSVTMPILENSLVNGEDKTTEKKKKKRSAWSLYLW